MHWVIIAKRILLKPLTIHNHLLPIQNVTWFQVSCTKNESTFLYCNCLNTRSFSFQLGSTLLPTVQKPRVFQNFVSALAYFIASTCYCFILHQDSSVRFYTKQATLHLFKVHCLLMEDFALVVSLEFIGVESGQYYESVFQVVHHFVIRSSRSHGKVFWFYIVKYNKASSSLLDIEPAWSYFAICGL